MNTATPGDDNDDDDDKDDDDDDDDDDKDDDDKDDGDCRRDDIGCSHARAAIVCLNTWYIIKGNCDWHARCAVA